MRMMILVRKRLHPGQKTINLQLVSLSNYLPTSPPGNEMRPCSSASAIGLASRCFWESFPAEHDIIPKQ